MNQRFDDRVKVRVTRYGTQYVRLSDLLMNREIIEELKAIASLLSSPTGERRCGDCRAMGSIGGPGA